MIGIFLIAASLGSTVDSWPHAVLVIRTRYELTPWSRTSQENLIAIRDQLNIPAPFASPSPSGLRTLFSPMDLLIIATILGIASVLTVIGKPASRRVIGLVIAFGWLSLIALTFAIDQPLPPFAVVNESTRLRSGNAVEFEPVHPTPVPRGAEVTVHARRGGWARVTVGSVSGWLPESSLLH